MYYNSATHCRFCGKDCSHTQGRLLDAGMVFCDINCHYLHEYNLEHLSKEFPDEPAVPDGE